MEQTPAAELPQISEWEVYKDTFAPPQPTRRSKPWERQPVSAHAPRLHGQKIWKKAGSIIKNHSTKENDNAQAELELEGMGARKRMKGVGEKENISDAKWLPHSNDNEIVAAGNVSPIKKNGLIGFDTDALLVPRKRTNANHLVTPRKGNVASRIPLMDVTMGSANKMEVDGESGAKVGDSASPTATPGRRTKAMRKSFRRMSRNDSAEDISMGEFESTKSSVEAASLEGSQPDLAQTTMSSQPVDIFGTSKSSEIIMAHPDAQVTVDEKSPDTLLEESENSSNTVSQLDTLVEEEEADFGSMQLQTELQDTLTPILQHDATIDTTPQKKTRSRTSRTPKTSPVKRSTRITRSSLLFPAVMTPGRISESASAQDTSFESFESFSPVKPHGKLRDTITTILESGAENGAINNELDSTMSDTAADAAAVSPPRVQEELAEELITEDNEMEDIQQALNMETTEDLDDEQPLPTESEDELHEDSLPESDSTDALDLCPPELPDYNLKQTPESPILAPSHNQDMDNSSEHSEDLENMEEITQEVANSADNHSLYPFELSSALSIIEDNAAADDTDVLRKFLTRVKADKEAKALNPAPSKRKRSLPHSPLQLPLGTIPNVSSPTSPSHRNENDDDVDELALDASPSKSPSKRGNPSTVIDDTDELGQPKAARRSGRTRLPVKSAPSGPSFIPLLRRGNQAGVTLKVNEDTEVVALTKANTRKNKGAAALPPLVLARKAEEMEDLAKRHGKLKEVFDEMKTERKGNKKGRNVVWAENIAQFRGIDARVEMEAILPLAPPVKKSKEVKKKPVVTSGLRKSKIAVGTSAKSGSGAATVRKVVKPKKK